jgi:hypothetical protein
MVVSGFGPYHHLCPNNAPAECADIIPIPWAIMLTLGFGVAHRWHELMLTPRPPSACLFFLVAFRIIYRIKITLNCIK